MSSSKNSDKEEKPAMTSREPEKMNMATKVAFVQKVGTAEEQASCVNELGQSEEFKCDEVLLRHGFTPADIGNNSEKEKKQR